jgi:hypothetical protein
MIEVPGRVFRDDTPVAGAFAATIDSLYVASREPWDYF